jgi:antitoxin component YwqK of YwqJK toxin-antitoxin module
MQFFLTQNYKINFLIAVVVFLLFSPLSQIYGQDNSFLFNSETTPLTIDLEAEDEDKPEPKKKKRKKNVYYDLKTKKGFVKTGFGNDVVIEVFNFLKEYEDPDPYVRDIYWLDLKKGVLKKSASVDKANAGILHGPYRKMIGNQILEEGIFYKGTKHGRWMTYNKNDFLMNKQKYYKGWPKESLVSYYDKERKKLKEVVPIEYGRMEGNYYYFHDNGELAVKGEFKRGEKVGVWSEYYKYRRKRKREIQYKKDPYEKNFIPYIVTEWDEKGDLIYDRESETKRLSSR